MSGYCHKHPEAKSWSRLKIQFPGKERKLFFPQMSFRIVVLMEGTVRGAVFKGKIFCFCKQCIFEGLAETVNVEGTICSLSHSAEFVVVVK